MAKDVMIGAHGSVDADSRWGATLPVVEQKRFVVVEPLPFAPEPSP